MKKVTTILVLLFSFVQYASGQSMASLITQLNEKAKETHGVIRMFSSTRPKVEIADNEVSRSDMGIKIMVKLDQDRVPLTTYTYEFDPGEIRSIKEEDMPSESPIGQLKITFSDAVAYITSHSKKEGTEKYFAKEVIFNFLKVEAGNAQKIKDILNQMHDVAWSTGKEKASELTSFMSTYKSFWYGGDGSSVTYKLQKAYASDCEIRFHYKMDLVSKKGDVSGTYLAVIPLKDIKSIRKDSKSRPSCVLLDGGKKGFARYKLKDSKYIEDGTIEEIPLFIDGTLNSNSSSLDVLKTLVKDCDGGKLKI